MRKILLLATTMAAMTKDCFSEPQRKHSIGAPVLSEEQKKRLEKQRLNEYHMYTVKGVQIKAKSKTDAKKIYSHKYATR